MERRDMIKLIKTSTQYEQALQLLQERMMSAPAPGTPEADHIELLGLLIEEYEKASSPHVDLDPVDAIEFRMEQAGLTARDLIPMIGSRSRVSEVLSRKRGLTLEMIRALHDRLGIPTESLVRPLKAPVESHDDHLADALIPLERFPLADMQRRGWISLPPHAGTRATPGKQSPSIIKEAVERFFAPVGGPESLYALYRKSDHIRGGRAMDRYALAAWTARISTLALAANLQSRFEPSSLEDDTWLDMFVRLSQHDDGPRRAIQALGDIGVTCIIEAHLPKTRLDGAALRLADGRPVIALTLRHDRLDNFWFTMMHEVAHLALHLTSSTSIGECFYDDLDVYEGVDARESDADAWAGEILVPEEAWEASAARYTPSPTTVSMLAQEIGVSEAVVAGKARHAFRNYRILNTLIGHGIVRRQFPDRWWPPESGNKEDE
jgi:HTH-type transcriptional regulator / antitoxin HigA